MRTSCKIRILGNLCRTCMGEQQTEVMPTDTGHKVKHFISLYDEHETKDSGSIRILDLLKQTSPKLTVENDDMLPKNICGNCLDNLVNIHEFQTNSVKVEQRLRSIIKNNCSSDEVDDDPLNDNSIQQLEGCENLNIEIDEPLMDVTNSVKGFFTLLEKDGKIIEVFKDLEKSDGETSECNEKCNTDDDVDTGARESNTNDIDIQSDFNYWKYIGGDTQDSNPEDKEQNIIGAGNVKYANERGISGRRIDKVTRKPGIAEKILGESNRKHKNDDEDVDRKLRHRPTITINKEDVAKEESSETEVSDFIDDDSEWEIPSDKPERFKSKTIKNISKLEDNKQVHKNEDPKVVIVADTQGFPCNICGKRLTTRPSLTMHLRQHLNPDKKTRKEETGHICPECGARLKTRVTFRRHLIRHELKKKHPKIKPINRYECEFCNRVFFQPGALRYHSQVHNTERPYLCSICGKSFAAEYHLTTHYARHGTELKYQCPKCPKRFRCPSSMSTHKATVHSTARPYVCDVCGASFKKTYNLTYHKKIHGEKTHKCDYCEMKFGRVDQCRRHMRTHTGEKPYKCRYCGRAYAQSNDMIKHLRIHLGDNVYRCELCPQAFRLLSEMRAHFALHINDDEETKSKNLQALKEEDERIQLKIESEKASEQQP